VECDNANKLIFIVN